MNELAIVIVNWNGGMLLRRCIESIRAHPPRVPYEIVVVDNASTDDSVAWLRTTDVRLIENRENAGFGKANNQAFAATRTPFVLLLNPDTEVTAGAINRLIEAMNDAGACGPRLVNPDGSLQPSVWPNPPTPLTILASALGLWRLIPRRLRARLLWGGHWAHDERIEVPSLFGAAMMVKREMLDVVCGFDPRFHLYAEDDEWCLRIRKAGWRILFEPRAVVRHQGSALTLQRWGRAERTRVKLESFFEFQRLALSPSHRIANLLAGCIVSAVHVLMRREDAKRVLWMHLAELRR